MSTNLINTIILIVCIVLYLSNIFILKKAESPFQLFFICWFNDLIAPIFALSIINLKFGKKISFYTISRIAILCTVFAVVWEIIGSHIKPNSVFDITDILCYYYGGIIYYCIFLIYNHIKSNRLWRVLFRHSLAF